MEPFLREPLLNCNNDPASHQHSFSEDLEDSKGYKFTDPDNIVFLKKRMIFEHFVICHEGLLGGPEHFVRDL